MPNFLLTLLFVLPEPVRIYIRSDPGYSINFDFRGRFDLELSSGCLADYVDLQLWQESTNR